MNLPVGIPTWVVEIISARARALEVSFDEALLLSLDVQSPDVLAEVAGWARKHGVNRRDIARRLHYDTGHVEDGITRFNKSRLPNVGGPS